MSRFLDDHSLVKACRAGQTEAFGLLVQRYQERLYPTILRLIGSARLQYALVAASFWALDPTRVADRAAGLRRLKVPLSGNIQGRLLA